MKIIYFKIKFIKMWIYTHDNFINFKLIKNVENFIQIACQFLLLNQQYL